MPKKEPNEQIGEDTKDILKGYYGMDGDTNLQYVNFSPPENKYLNERTEDGEET